MRILLTGGSGLLGSELQKIEDGLDAPTRKQLDITDAAAVAAYIESSAPDIVIHAAAATDNRLIEANPSEGVAVNISGTVNIVQACIGTRIRLVYISTDYVYKGDRGNYSEEDEILPGNLYTWTKLGGESAVRAVPNHLIVRTSFGASEFAYPGAFADKWTSKDYVDVVAPDILEAAISPLTGVLHIGGERRSMLEYAQARNPQVAAIELGDSAHRVPVDSSLDLSRWQRFKSGHEVVRSVTACRICESKNLSKYLDLGMLPLANNLAVSASAARSMDRFPMQVLFCNDCALSQLSVVVDPRELFSHYTYRSSINQGYVRHCREMAKHVGQKIGLTASDLVVDIAGNDGALLNEFKEELGVKVLNIDPAQNIAAIAEQRGIPTINDFWSDAVADQVAAEHGRPKLITATNVFAHVDDTRGFIAAAKRCLDAAGALVLEFPYAVDFIEEREFDTIYFEHLSYVLIKPVQRLAESLGLDVFDVQKQDIHGGTARVYIGHRGAHEIEASVSEFLSSEARSGFHDFERYQRWTREIDALIDDIRIQVTNLKQNGARIAAFAASAKGNTLLNACGLDGRAIDYIVDDTPEKIGKFSPGNGVPIVGRDRLADDPPDYLLILAWNFGEEIVASTSSYSGAGGRYIMPIPKFRVIDG